MNAAEAATLIVNQLRDPCAEHINFVAIIQQAMNDAKREAMEAVAESFEKALPDWNRAIAKELRRIAEQIGKDATDGEAKA